MEIMAGLIELKPGSESKVQEWRAVIASRLDEVMETLRAEGVEIESWFEVSIGGKPYLLWYIRAESAEKVWQVFNQSTADIDRFHLEAMTAITAANISATPLLDLDLQNADPRSV